MSVIPKVFKDEFENLDYFIDYDLELALYSDSISTSTWIVPSSTAEAASTIVLDGTSVDYDVDTPSPKYRDTVSDAVEIDGNQTTVFLSGGELGQTYRIMNRIVTTSGRKYARVFDLVIERRGV